MRLNFTLGVINGALWMFSRALYEPETILPAFAVALMGDNPIWVALLVSVVNAGWFWPPVVVAPALATRQRRHIYYQVSSAVRIAMLVVIWWLTKDLAGGSPATAFWLIALCYLIYTSGGGVGLVPFMSVVTDSIPVTRRGLFFGLRYLFGGLLAFGAGFWVKWVLSPQSGETFPGNYAMVFGLAAIVGTISLVSFCFAAEPPHKIESRQFPLRKVIIRGMRRAVREPDFRLLTLTRILYTGGSGLVFPFLVPFAYKYLSMTEAMVGLLVAVRQLCYSLSNIPWARMSDRQGNVPLFVVSGVITLGSVALALATAVLPAVPLGTVWGLHFDLRLAVLWLAFATSGIGNAGQVVAHNNYLLEFTPERTRPVYMGTYYMTLVPMSFISVPAALLIGVHGHYLPTFGIGALVLLLMVVLEAEMNPLRKPGESGMRAAVPPLPPS